MDESWYWEMTFFIDLKHGKENTLYMESYIKKIIKTYVFENNFFAHYYFKKKKKNHSPRSTLTIAWVTKTSKFVA